MTGFTFLSIFLQIYSIMELNRKEIIFKHACLNMGVTTSLR